MKRFMLLLIPMLFLVQMSPAQTAQNVCTLENTIDFQTALALASADSVSAVVAAANIAASSGEVLTYVQRVNDISQGFQTKVKEAAGHLSNACLVELLMATDRSEKCAEPMKVASTKALQYLTPIAEKYAKTGEREPYEIGMRQAMTITMRSLPRECWYSPLSQPGAQAQGPNAPRVQACPSQWISYDSCQEDNKKAIVNGAGSLNNLTRKYVQPCFTPACPRY